MDIQSYMTGVGRQARAASRLVAKADTATKNRALTLTADAIDGRSEYPISTAQMMDVIAGLEGIVAAMESGKAVEIRV